MPGGHISTFPSSHSVYVININIIFIFTSSVCWALHSAETNGQYLSWVTCSAAWSPLIVPEASGGTPAMVLLLYSDKPFLPDWESSRGQEWTSKRGQGVAQRGGQGCTSGGEQASETPGHTWGTSVSLQGTPVFLLSWVSAFPKLCYYRPLRSKQ